MALSKVALSMGRISKLLPGNQGKSIIGSGCIVSLSPDGDRTMISLITTSQVITENELLSSDPSIVVEFLDKGNWKPITANPCFMKVANTLPGRNLGGTGDDCKGISFLVIPVQNLIVQGNPFGKLLRKLRGTSLEKRALPCNRQDDETLQAAMSTREILCHVMWDTKTDFNTEPHCIEFDGEEREFALTPPSDNNRWDKKYHRLNDFPGNERPKGAALLNAKGEFVGMLVFEASEKKRLLPLFLPTVDMQASQPFNKESFKSYNVGVRSEIKVTPEAANTCAIDHTKVKPGEDGEGNAATSNNNPTLTHEAASPENGCMNSAVQGSGTSATNPNQRENGSLEEISSSSGRDPLPCESQPPLQLVSEKSASKDEDTEVSYTSNMSSDESASGEDCQEEILLRSSDESASGEVCPEETLLRSSDESASGEVCPEETLLRSSDESASGEVCPEETLLSKSLQPSVTDEIDPGRLSNLGATGDDHLPHLQIDSLSHHHENIPAQQHLRPGLLTQTSCHEGGHRYRDEEYQFGIGETGSPKPFEPPTLRESTAQIVSNQQASDLSREEGRPFTQDNVNSPKRVCVSPGDTLKDVIVSNSTAMDITCLHLDRSVGQEGRGVQLIQGWEHLADKFDVPVLTKKKFANLSKKSPSESMFEYLRMENESLPITALKKALLFLDIKDVVKELNNNSRLSKDTATVTDLWENELDTLFTICLMLDDWRCINTWKELGIRLEIPGAILRKFDHVNDVSPSTQVLNIIHSSEPQLSVATMMNTLKRSRLPTCITKELGKLSGGSTIKSLLHDMEVLENVTGWLDLRESYWFSFGLAFGIERVKLQYLKPPCMCSPTEALMLFLVQRNPELTVKIFIETLTNMKRKELIDELKRMFHFSWIDHVDNFIP